MSVRKNKRLNGPFHERRATRNGAILLVLALLLPTGAAAAVQVEPDVPKVVDTLQADAVVDPREDDSSVVSESPAIDDSAITDGPVNGSRRTMCRL